MLPRRMPLVGKLLIAASLVVVGTWTRLSVERTHSNRVRELVAPPLSIKYFTFGYNHVIADSLWIRSLQDFDYCEKSLSKNLCTGKGWLYQMLNLITDLSPKFRIAYSAGGIALTVIISDIEGASRFFDKAVLEFPNDWVILYKAAYHCIFEEKNLSKAASLAERAAQHGAPDWVYSLAARLYTEGGRREWAQRMVQELRQGSILDERIIQRIEEKLGDEK